MLSRKFRFHGHNSVRRAYRSGRSVRGTLGSLHISRNDKIHVSKIAVVVSRKVEKSAVRRNRIRRRIYEIMRGELPKISTPTELVFTVYQAEAAQMAVPEIRQAVHDLLKKAKL